MRLLITFISVLALTGCANNPSFAPQGSKNTATIAGQNTYASILNAVWKNFSVEAVDGKRVNHGFMVDHHRTVVTVEAGEHRFVINGSFNDGLGGPGPREAYIVLTANIEAGKAYRLNGEPRDNLMVTWLENAETGEKLSAEASQPYTSLRGSGGGMVPIFIPKAR